MLVCECGGDVAPVDSLHAVFLFIQQSDVNLGNLSFLKQAGSPSFSRGTPYLFFSKLLVGNLTPRNGLDTHPPGG